MNVFSALIATVFLLLGNAYFVGSEFAVMGARRSRIEPLVDQGKRGAKTVLYALENLTLMLATCQLGVTVCSVGLGAVSEPAIAGVLSAPLYALGVPPAITHTIAFLIALLLVVFLHVVLGEMVPKNMTITHPEELALLFMPPLVLLSKIFYPVVASLNWLSNHVVRLFGAEPKSEVASAFTADEVASIVEVSEAAGVLNADAELLSGALEFSEHTAADVMVPLDQLEAVPLELAVEDFEELCGRTGFSRFPVIGERGQLVGYVHLKDVLDVPQERRGEPIPEWKIRPLPRVAARDEVESALKQMQRARTHMAAVVQEESGSSAVSSPPPLGVIFLEDIVEELVGEVRDAMQRN
ncbi:MAG: hemolysin family protein [Arcanobacterium sp.]|nr:hemolysin family protein [Arcanobacterium sp.]MDY5588382.1 hemolysin family protein [Arcanobacterium sp.]